MAQLVPKGAKIGLFVGTGLIGLCNLFLKTRFLQWKIRRNGPKKSKETSK